MIGNIINYINDRLKSNMIDLSTINEELNNIKSRYPIEKFLTMKIEEWVKLGDQYCFINMIENKTNSIASGFIGFNRNRLFYQGKKDLSPLVVKAISKEKRFNGMDINQIFPLYMKEIYNFINSFSPDSYEPSDYLYGANVIKAKIAMIYCPNYKIGGFTSRKHAAKLAEYLDIPVEKKDDTLGINIKINKYIIDNDPSLEKINSYILGRFIWDFYVENIMKRKNSELLTMDAEHDSNFIQKVGKTKLIKINLDPRPAEKPIIENGVKKYYRNPVISKYALKLAGYRCECGKDHISFIRKSDGKNYTEPHHIIPISAQENFKNSLDCVPNIISLCSNCHNRLHYGKDIKSMLKNIYEQRKDELRKHDINITFEELLSYYK